MTKPDHYRIAYFISPHGYGHAARGAAVMEAISKINPTIRFEVFTQVPRWFFDDSLSENFTYHSLLTDIGLVQESPLKADLVETLRRLNHFLPFDHSGISDLANLLKTLGCGLIICDIAPMGIAVAKEAGMPSLLVENFTWDWLYEEYVKSDGRIAGHIDYLKGIFNAADFHIQTEPVCRRRAVDLTTFPVSRKMRTPAHETRKKLRIPERAKAVMITMGGIGEQYAFLEKLARMKDMHFVIPGASTQVKTHGGLTLLPHHSGYFHPDLINACDAVIGKAGYSTLAEIYYSGVPFGYIVRRRFRESTILESYIQDQMSGLPIAENEFYSGRWLSVLPELLALPRIDRHCSPGAEQVAYFVYELIHSTS